MKAWALELTPGSLEKKSIGGGGGGGTKGLQHQF